jgi:hypothetical protein
MPMTRQEIADCNTERLQGWAGRLTGVEATAVRLVGIGQGATTGGTMHVIVPEASVFDRTTIRALLRQALEDLAD